ncbi:hypothetical protein W97_07771 [Coniosporium apollinis CBS 100218]|uniref:Developmental regulatory protein wetA n=1 Tax=Coniosporium apollinis (strain CBS 100218) TaxID=1168221 RepID=R7Z339_CONA1|nr:uncharacterized protein W97_07771 [Coniosporium apollinis CBS 100218]EON68513.1 hypothetical protein W97_07771 [Coniosporium apollinis CBS 100218]
MAMLQQHIGFPMRPADKEVDWSDTYDDLFGQYVETDLLELSDNTFEPSSSDDLPDTFFDVSGSSNGSDPVDVSPMPTCDGRRTESRESWQKTLRYLEQNPALSPQGNQASIYPESCGRAAASDTELFSLLSLEPKTPQIETAASFFSTPGSPSPLAYRNRKLTNTPVQDESVIRKVSHGIKKQTRKSSRSPRMMRSSFYRTGLQDLWNRRTETGADRFNIQIPATQLPASPPPSAKFNQNGFEITGEHSAGFKHEVSSPRTNHFDFNAQMRLTPLSSPVLGCSNGGRSSFYQPAEIATAALAATFTTDPLHALQTPPTTAPLQTAPWGPESSILLDLSFSVSPDFSAHRSAALDWPPTSAPQPCGPPPTYHSSGPNLLGLSAVPGDLSTAGLMISCEPSALGGLDMELDASGFAAEQAGLMAMQGYTTTPARQTQRQRERQRQLASPSRSPSSSPPPITPSRHRRTSSVAKTPRSHHRRSKSSHHGSHHGANPSGGGHSRTSSAPVGFVNFTADDSRKILTGVAPSGSSKTKARREKEAADKRRKLSLAATRAVLEAGGDLGRLKQEGLFFLNGEA